MRYLESVTRKLHLFAGNNGKGPVCTVGVGDRSTAFFEQTDLQRKDVRALINALRRWEYRTGGSGGTL